MTRKRKTIRLDSHEADVLIESLNRTRTERLEGNKCADDAGDLILKIVRAREKKVRIRDEAR